MSRGFVLAILLLSLLIPNVGCAKRWDVLSTEERILLHRILAHWETWVPARKKEGRAPLMTFEELYSGLALSERDFLDRIRKIKPGKNFGPEEIHFKRLDDQWIVKQGKKERLDPQYLPRKVYRSYEAMMKAMEQDLGRRLLVESGYRSPACQLYTFLFYLPKHHYSLAETSHWVALPGQSEHGSPRRQAIDFINQAGINGEDNAEEFERLPEYAWLQRRAREFGFELSYPRGKKGITFEPWHWRYI